MDWGQLGLLLTGLGGIFGVFWTIYAARKKDKRQDQTELMRDARQVIESYKEQVTGYKQEITDMRDELERLRWRFQRLERREKQLMALLTKEQLLALPREDDFEPRTRP